jgi:hypothetical protein
MLSYGTERIPTYVGVGQKVTKQCHVHVMPEMAFRAATYLCCFLIYQMEKYMNAMCAIFYNATAARRIKTRKQNMVVNKIRSTHKQLKCKSGKHMWIWMTVFVSRIVFRIREYHEL